MEKQAGVNLRLVFLAYMTSLVLSEAFSNCLFAISKAGISTVYRPARPILPVLVFLLNGCR
jgi:hypothetical protein